MNIELLQFNSLHPEVSGFTPRDSADMSSDIGGRNSITAVSRKC
jgi:hypothetical protein